MIQKKKFVSDPHHPFLWRGASVQPKPNYSNANQLFRVGNNLAVNCNLNTRPFLQRRVSAAGAIDACCRGCHQLVCLLVSSACNTCAHWSVPRHVTTTS